MNKSVGSLFRFLRNRLFDVVNYITSFYHSYRAKRNSPLSYYGVDINTKSEVFSRKVRARFSRGNYEKQEKKAVESYYSGEHSLIDLGASSGFISAFADRISNSESKVIAVEANNDIIPILQDTKRRNKCDFIIEKKAYHPCFDSINFYKHSLTIGGSAHRKTKNKVRVKCLSLEEIVKKHKLYSSVIVCDIEGGEVDLFREELDLISKICPLIIVEMHSFSEETSSIREKILSSGFEKVDKLSETEVYANEKFEYD